MLAGIDLRRRWGSLLVLAIFVGIVGTLTFAITAGARRSGTSLSRFNDYSRSADLEIDTSSADPQKLAQFKQLPGVRALSHLKVYAAPVDNQRDLTLTGRVPDGDDTDRELVVRGRLADPDAPGEITISESLAQLRDLRLGDELHATFFTREQIDNARTGADLGPPRGPRVAFDIVGITRRPLDLGDKAATGGVVVATPGFVRAHPDVYAYVDYYAVQTENHKRDVPRLMEASKRYFPQDGYFQAVDLTNESSGAANAINVITSALWIFAAVSATAGAITLGLVLTRDVSRLRSDEPTWRGLGLTHAQRAATVLPRAIAIAGLGVVLGFVGAALCSPFLPVGIARRADPNHGFHIDWVALGLGALLLAVFVVAVSGIAALRASQSLTRAAAPTRATFTGFRAGAPTFNNGARLALQSGRGERAVPVRSAFVGVALAVVGVIALGTFAGSLDHLVATPHLYGWTFDFRLAQQPDGPPCLKPNPGLDKDREVEAVALLCYTPIEFDGHQITAWSLRRQRGEITPEIMSGRAPTAADEIAFGSASLAMLHKRVGDTVRVAVPGKGGPGRRHRIVGEVVLPRVRGEDIQSLADGAFVSDAGMTSLLPTAAEAESDQINNISEILVGRFAPGVDQERAAARITAMKEFIPPNGDIADFNQEPGAHLAAPPPEVERLRKIDWFPPMLTAVLTALALIAVGHTIIASTRRRRRDLAMLKALGFTRGQVRATVAWQATIIAFIGLVVGVPLGVLLGRFAWTRIADSLGINVVVVVPALVVLGVAAAAIVLVNLAAFIPARSVARMRPAVALAAE
jgi:hypothetical protein